MPRPEHFQPSTDDWPAVRALWLDWLQGKRPDLKHMAAVSEAAQVPLATLNKKTARWKREEQDKLDQAKAALDANAAMFKISRGPRPKAKEPEQPKAPTGTGDRSRLNASTDSSPLVLTDEFRGARGQAKEALEAAMTALIEEVRVGSGASRVAAIREGHREEG